MTNTALDAPPSAAGAGRRKSVLTIFGFWAVYFALNTLRRALEDSPDQGSAMARRLAVSLLGICFTYLLYLLLRRLEHRSIRTLVTTAFVAAVPVSLAYSAVNHAAFYWVNPLPSTLQEMASHPVKISGGQFGIIVDMAIEWYFFIASWAVLHIALTYAERVRHAERRAALYRAAAQAAQLKALRYQINPHFLFNTLNSLSTLVLCGRNDEAEKMIANLAGFLRASLTADPTEDIPLAEEIRMQQLYLGIEQIRFPKRLQVDLDIGSEVAEAPVPGLILQPLVENAIKYGVSRTARPVTIAIRAHDEGGRLHVTVEDDGEPEGDGSAPRTNGHGVGLRNVCERLAARFNGAADCTYGPRPQGGFRVDLVMPRA